MFFVLYALALLMLAATWALGISLQDAALAYVVMALLLSVWINAARNRRRAAMPRRERRRATFPLQHSH